MFRLAHLSDVHLGPLPDVNYRKLLSKRAVGYVNWQRNRRRLLQDDVLDRIILDLKAQRPDHVAVTGDLVNLALDQEIALARLWLDELGPPTQVSVVPGNHDAYVPGAFDHACEAWAPYMQGDGQIDRPRRELFPFLRVRKNVALIGATSARASAPFMATGYYKEGQARRMGELLAETGLRKLFRVVLIHHPPVRGAVPAHKRLMGIGLFQNAVREHGAELVLHGHSHLPSLFSIAGPRGPVPVVGVAAGGQAPGGSKPAAQFNLIEIDGAAPDWRIKLTRRGLLDGGGKPEVVRVDWLSRARGAYAGSAVAS
ncbi:MAG TPA: metallophosphoesterase [Mesorhizobium sp.]|jgi:3',5'-cyclic AMP phosphodiesterase CpdA|nr:metallophosphoesterase [Mesorhizobium sp.]